MPAATVLTTTHDPAPLEGYYTNALDYGRLEDVTVIVIPDRKTRVSAFARCSDLARRGARIVCPDLNEQENFLRRLGFAAALIPYDSDNRRKVRRLMVLEGTGKLVISIDEGNYSRRAPIYSFAKSRRTAV